ncbi:hypothetical protein Aperf_G00000007958 [Anoplocephala perfoliata]
MSGEDTGATTVNSAVPPHLIEIPLGLLHSLLRWLRCVGVRVGQKRLLLGACWTTGSLALLLLLCAIAMDSWLFTVEREPDEASNATFLITLHSGLWRFYSMRPAAFFPPVGLLLLCFGGGCGLAACWGQQRARLLLFLSGGFCIISGILTLIGIVLYVGSVSLAFDSISGPLRVETRYVYSFGTAFRLCISAFVLSEFSGVFVIHLLLAELRHRQNQHIEKSRYAMMNSISTDILSPSRIPTATTSVAQISLTENCLDKAKASDALPFSSLNRRPQPPKTSHFPVENHVTNPLRVKVIPCNRSSTTKNRVPETTTHSLESLNPATNNSDEEAVHWGPVEHRRTIGPVVGSMNSVHSALGYLRRGNASSAVNIRTEEEIPDLIPYHKSAQGSKGLFHYSCRECEQILKMQHQRHRNVGTLVNERSPSLCRRMPVSESTSSTTSDSMTPSISATYSSYSESEEKLSNKLYYDQSPRRLTPRSHCLRQRVNPTPSASTIQRQITRAESGRSSKTLSSLTSPMRRHESNTTSESEQRETETSAAYTMVCRCSEKFSKGEIMMAENPPSSSVNTPLQRSKKRTKSYQQVTSI